jgi:hypothetical protein
MIPNGKKYVCRSKEKTKQPACFIIADCFRANIILSLVFQGLGYGWGTCLKKNTICKLNQSIRTFFKTSG